MRDQVLSRFKPGDNVPAFATAQVLAGRFVKVTGDKTDQGDYPVTHCGAGERAFGVSERRSADPALPAHAMLRRVNVARHGHIARVETGAAVTATDLLTSDATGRAVPVGGAGTSTLVTGTVGANNALLWTSRVDGRTPTVTIVDPPGNSVALSVDVDGDDIIVTSATDGASAMTSTAAQVAAAILEHDTASQMVTVGNSGASTGAGVVTAVAKTALSRGGTGAAGHANGEALETAAGAGEYIDVDLF